MILLRHKSLLDLPIQVLHHPILLLEQLLVLSEFAFNLTNVRFSSFKNLNLSTLFKLITSLAQHLVELRDNELSHAIVVLFLSSIHLLHLILEIIDHACWLHHTG